LSSETFPDGYWKFVDCWNARDQRDAGSCARRPEVKLISNACIRNCFGSVRNTSGALDWFVGFRLVRGQKRFRKKIRHECSGPGLWAEVTFAVKFWKRESNRRSWDSAVCGQSPRGRKSGWPIAEPSRFQLVANLAVKLLMERLCCRPIKPNHLERYDRPAAALLRARFPLSHADCAISPWIYSSSERTKLPKRVLVTLGWELFAMKIVAKHVRVLPWWNCHARPR